MHSWHSGANLDGVPSWQVKNRAEQTLRCQEWPLEVQVLPSAEAAPQEAVDGLGYNCTELSLHSHILHTAAYFTRSGFHTTQQQRQQQMLNVFSSNAWRNWSKSILGLASLEKLVLSFDTNKTPKRDVVLSSTLLRITSSYQVVHCNVFYHAPLSGKNKSEGKHSGKKADLNVRVLDFWGGSPGDAAPSWIWMSFIMGKLLLQMLLVYTQWLSSKLHYQLPVNEPVQLLERFSWMIFLHPLPPPQHKLGHGLSTAIPSSTSRKK